MEKFRVALASDPNPRRLSHGRDLDPDGYPSGRAFAGLQDDAVTILGDSISLRIPVGRLHNDRYVSLLPPLVGTHCQLSRASRARADQDACSSATTASPSTGAPSIVMRLFRNEWGSATPLS